MNKPIDGSVYEFVTSTQVSVNAHVPGSSRETLAFTVRDMLLRLWVTVQLWTINSHNREGEGLGVSDEDVWLHPDSINKPERQSLLSFLFPVSMDVDGKLHLFLYVFVSYLGHAKIDNKDIVCHLGIGLAY